MISFKYLVTAALPYVNNEPHLGNFIGSLLPADVYARYLKMSGHECIYVCGSDEYGTTTEMKASAEHITPKELTDRNYKIVNEGYRHMGCRPDIFSRTSNPAHTRIVQGIYERVRDNGYTYEKEIEQLYCETDRRFLADRFVEGTCPHCGYARAKGDQCESCGKVLEPTELVGPKCTLCGNAPVRRRSSHVFFALSKLTPELYVFVEKQDWFASAKNFALSWIKEGLEDIDIQRDIKWGVPIPEKESGVLYSWFDAPIGYITFSEELGKEQWWHDRDTRLVHFIGKDNIAFHTMFFPGILMAAGGYILPWKVASYEFLNWEEGEKFSKSRGIGLTVPQAAELYPADYWRYYLLTILTEKKDTNFSWDDFQGKVNVDLNDTIGNFVHRTLMFADRFYEGKVPEPGSMTRQDEAALEAIKATADAVASSIESISLRDALVQAVDLARLGNQYIQGEAPWANEERKPAVVYVALNMVQALSIILAPFIPESAAKVRHMLNSGAVPVWTAATEGIKHGQQLGKPVPLFSKITDAEIEEHKRRYGKVGAQQ